MANPNPMFLRTGNYWYSSLITILHIICSLTLWEEKLMKLTLFFHKNQLSSAEARDHLIFGYFEPWCSYKIVHMKNIVYLLFVTICEFIFLFNFSGLQWFATKTKFFRLVHTLTSNMTIHVPVWPGPPSLDPWTRTVGCGQWREGNLTPGGSVGLRYLQTFEKYLIIKIRRTKFSADKIFSTSSKFRQFFPSKIISWVSFLYFGRQNFRQQVTFFELLSTEILSDMVSSQ